MKRITTLLLAAIFMVSGAVAGHAESNIDVKVKGQWDFVFGWAQNTQHFKKTTRKDDNGIAAQRVRTQVNFITSENLQAVLQFEIGDVHWGNKKQGGARGTDGINVETKHAYLDWMVPTTDLHIRMGLQALALPMATGLGSPIFDDDVAAVVANYKFDDTFSVTAFWARPYNYRLNDHKNDDGSKYKDDVKDYEYGKNRHIDDEMDMFGLIAPISLDGVTITPWGVWANIGDASGFYQDLFDVSMTKDKIAAKENARTTAWWAGLGVAVDLWDPLTFAVDAMYGHMQATNFNTFTLSTPILFDDPVLAVPGEDGRVGAKGWFIAANLDYKLDWGTPGIFGWYATGDDYKDVRDHSMLGRMPVMTQSSGFHPTSFGFDGGFGISSDQVIGYSGTGMWGIGLQVADMSFIEDLTHTIRFAYMQGTNDHKIVRKGMHDDVTFDGDFYLTDKDSAFEINFDHKYQIYENLAAVVELGYINMDLDRKTWRGYEGENKTDDAWKAQLSFQYKF